MMGILIIASIPIVMLGSLIYNNSLATKERLNTILGVALPIEEFKNPKVKEIVKNFKKSNYRLAAVLALGLLPIILLKYSSLMTIYLMVWFGVSYLLFRNNIVKSNKILRELKSQNGWLVHQRKTLSIDTYVSLSRDLMPVSKLWLTPSLIISIIAVFLAFYFKDRLDTLGLTLAFTSVSTVFILVVMYFHYSSKPTETISEDSNINLIYNKSFKRVWTIGTVVGATIESLLGLLSILVVQRGNANEIALIFCFFPMLVFIVGIAIIQKRINKLQSEVIKSLGNELYSDNDDCWKNGYYYNPADSRHSVQDRYTDNTTYNLATKKGKAIFYGGYVFAAIIIIAVFIPILMFDFVGHKVVVSNSEVEIKAPFYGSTLEASDIKSVELVDDIKVKTRTNGYGGNTYSLGYFSLEDGSNVKLYLYTDNPPFIKVVNSDKTIYVNGLNKEETDRYYKLLKDSLK